MTKCKLDPKRDLNSQIRDHMLLELDWNVSRLATELHTSRPNMSRVLSGKEYVSIKMALKLEPFMGVSAEQMLSLQLMHDVAKERTNK